jgi:A/G-specific adenine glycosylase
VESKVVNEVLWHNASILVDDGNPGDFNQALMELGATVCTPKNPNCSICPISSHCLAFNEVKQYKEGNRNKFLNVKKETDLNDIEECVTTCNLCLPENEKYLPENGVTNYPRKGKKISQREESTLVCILKCKSSNKFASNPVSGLCIRQYLLEDLHFRMQTKVDSSL